MQSPGYVPLIGSSSHSWGWNLVDNHLLHDGECLSSYPLQNNAPKYQTGERIRVVLDCDRHTLSFEKNYEFLGVAFVGLPSHLPLYPAVSAVYGNTEVSMVYCGLPLDGWNHTCTCESHQSSQCVRSLWSSQKIFCFYCPATSDLSNPMPVLLSCCFTLVFGFLFFVYLLCWQITVSFIWFISMSFPWRQKQWFYY